MRDIYSIRASLLDCSKPKKVILDTDTYNEVDDQFALAYAMLASDRCELLSVNAAPFLNNRSESAEDGMEKSYNEILNIMNLAKPDCNIKAYKGSRAFMSDKNKPEVSPAAENIINTALTSDEPIYVAAIGAITNVAAAITLCPEIKEKINVVWLGGNALHWPHSHEFNMHQDRKSSQIVMDSGVPLVQIPCAGVCDHLHTTIPELEYYLAGKNPLCDYLVNIVRSYTNNPFAWSKVIWDVSAIACMILPNSMDRTVIPTPRLTDDGYLVQDFARHPFIYVRSLNRDVIYGDLFRILTNA